MSLVRFKHRSTLPETPEEGSFYWIGTDENTQLWFAYGSTQNEMILLNEKVDLSSIEQSITNIENQLPEIERRLDDIDLSPYVKGDVLEEKLESMKNDIMSRIEDLTSSDFEDFVTRDEVQEMLEGITPDVELDDSDYEAIAEKVKLTWQII